MTHAPFRSRAAAAAAALLLTAPITAVAQPDPTTLLDLIVIEAGTGRPVADAAVRIAGVIERGWTGQDGRVRIGRVPEGRRLVTIDRPGYAAQRMTIGFGREPVTGSVELEVLPITLAPVSVVAQQQRAALRERGFYRRLREGQGAILTSEDIERYRPVQTIDLFRRIRGFTVIVDNRGRTHVSSTRGAVSATRPCVPQMYLNGVAMGAGNPDEYVSPNQLEAMEAYAGPATIPPEYNRTGSACGVILFWTRVGR